MIFTQEQIIEHVQLDLAIRERISQIYSEWQDFRIEFVGKGLKKRDSFYEKASTKKFYILSLTYNEKDVYINAKREGALKFPISVLCDPNWKSWLEKKLTRERNLMLIKKLSD